MPPTEKRRLSTDARREQLLASGARLLAERPHDEVSIEEIARAAGVSKGLLYHYFRSKEEVLETIFRETWGVLVVETQRIEESDAPLSEQLRRFARIYLGSWLITPDAICVLVREIARSPDVGKRVDEIRAVFLALTRMIEAAKQRGEVREDCNPALAAFVVYGSLEEILTGWVLGQLPGEEHDVERAVSTVVDVAHAGLAA